jgi:hypothetical protein
MLIKSNPRVIEILNQHGVDYKCCEHWIEFNHEIMINDNPILGYLLEDDKIFSRLKSHYNNGRDESSIVFLINNHWDPQMLERLISNLKCDVIWGILCYVNNKIVDINIIVILAKNGHVIFG